MSLQPAPSVTRFAWLSIGVSIVTLALKTFAWLLTGSVGLLSDALESIVNLAGGVVALSMLTLAARPADQEHAHGHGKAEYFSSGFEGCLILIAAVCIACAAISRLMNLRPLEELGIGLVVSAVASIINFVTARRLLHAGRTHNSIALEADAQHLLTDVWTSAGVIAGVGLIALTDWLWLDPAVALLVSANIVWTGYQLLRRSVEGLMDVSLPNDKLEQIDAVLAEYREKGLKFMRLRTRQAGGRAFVTLHVLTPGDWSVREAHACADRIETDILAALGQADVTTHIEPMD